MRLTFGDAADRWLTESVSALRPRTRESYTGFVNNHLRPRWGARRLDAIDVLDAATLVREMRAAGFAEKTIAGACHVGGRVFKFARRYCGWQGASPFAELEPGERARAGDTRERRIYTATELAQVLDASTEPWRTLFRLASLVGPRESELLGLRWEDLDLTDLTTRRSGSGGRSTATANACGSRPRRAARRCRSHDRRPE